MSIKDPIEPSLHSKFEAEKLSRVIQDCNDIDILRGIAFELLKISQQKAAMATWATSRALEAEERTMQCQQEYIKGLNREKTSKRK